MTLRIIGIDPGSRTTGFGVVERRGSRVVHVVHGTLRSPASGTLSERLAELHEQITAILVREKPDLAVVEQVFVAANVRSALVLGQARGIALAALGTAGIPVHELAPRSIKSAVVGSGAASKAQVQTMVARLLQLEVRPASDAADALAAAICQAHVGALTGLSRPGRRKSGMRGASIRDLQRRSS